MTPPLPSSGFVLRVVLRLSGAGVVSGGFLGLFWCSGLFGGFVSGGWWVWWGVLGVFWTRVVVVDLPGVEFLGGFPVLDGWTRPFVGGSGVGGLCFDEGEEEEGDAGGGEDDDEGGGLGVDGHVAVDVHYECGGHGSPDEAAGGAGEEGCEPLGVHVLPESVQPLLDGLPGGVLGGLGGV